MARCGVRLSDAQWAKIEPHLPRLNRRDFQHKFSPLNSLRSCVCSRPFAPHCAQLRGVFSRWHSRSLAVSPSPEIVALPILKSCVFCSPSPIVTCTPPTMSERRKIQGKISALTAQGKASGLVMSVVPFILLGVLYVMEPQMVGLMFTSMLGNIILSLVVAMIWLASFVIGKIVDIDI